MTVIVTTTTSVNQFSEELKGNERLWAVILCARLRAPKKKSLLIDFCSSASHKFCRRAGRAVELPHVRTSKGPSSATARVVEERDWGGREKSK